MIAKHHSQALVPSLVHDRGVVGAMLLGFRDEARAQRVSRQLWRCEACFVGDAFDDERYRKIGEALVTELFVSVDRPEHRTVADAGEFEPVLHGTHRGSVALSQKPLVSVANARVVVAVAARYFWNCAFQLSYGMPYTISRASGSVSGRPRSSAAARYHLDKQLRQKPAKFIRSESAKRGSFEFGTRVFGDIHAGLI
jgi:hypothetical protein